MRSELITSILRRSTWLLLFAIAALACEGRPVPLTAAKGSTVLIPIGSGSTDTALLGDGAKTGYGTVDAPDPQRGRLRVWLEDEANCNNPNFTADRELEVRAVTRVVADPASFAGLSQGAQAGEQAGQIVVIANVPASAVANTYKLCMKRYTPSLWNGSAWDEQPAAQSPTYDANLTVLNVAGQATPFEANLGAGWFTLDALGVQDDFTPLPRLGFTVDTSLPVGAVRLVVSYPENRANVWGVLAEPLGDPVTWGAGALLTVSETTSGQLDIQALIPEGVGDPVFSIVFELTQPDAPPPLGGALQTTNFVFSTIEAWDVSGASVSVGVTGTKIF